MAARKSPKKTPGRRVPPVGSRAVKPAAKRGGGMAGDKPSVARPAVKSGSKRLSDGHRPPLQAAQPAVKSGARRIPKRADRPEAKRAADFLPQPATKRLPKPATRLPAKSPATLSSNGAGNKGSARLLLEELVALRHQMQNLETVHYETDVQRERLTDIHNFGPVGCVILNRQGGVNDINFSAAALLRRNRQTLFNMPFAVCIDRNSLGDYLDHLRRCHEHRGGVSTDLEIRQPDGRLVSVRLLTSQIPSSRHAHALYQTVIIDLSEQKALEQTLRDSEEQLRMALHCANAGHWTIDLGTRQVHWSPEFCALLGLRPEKAPATPEAFTQILHREDRAAAEQALQALLLGDSEHFHGVYRFRRPAGELRWLEMFGRIAHGRQQQAPWVTGVAFDITPHKRTERQLLRVRGTLEAKVKARTADLEAAKTALEKEMTDRRRLERQVLEISEREQRRIGQDLHDGLGQQITGIIFHAHMLQKLLAGKGAKEADAAAQIMDLLNDAKVQARHIARGLQPVDPSPRGLMAGLDRFADATTSLYRITCRFDCPEPVLITEHVTATHLFRIAQEAVANGFRHGEATAIDIRLRRRDGILELEIADDGRGLPKRALSQGGLGMRFMKYRAEVIGGTFEVRSGPRGGTVIRCRVGSEVHPGESK